MHKIKQGFCGKVGEYMIFDELVVTINALDNLKKKTDLKNNKALQEILMLNTDCFFLKLIHIYQLLNMCILMFLMQRILKY